MLENLSKEVLKIYRELYRNNWPQHVVSFFLLDHFIDRFKKFPEWERKVHFYKLKNEHTKIDYDATFVFVNGSHIYFDSLTADIEKLQRILNSLNYDEEKTFVTIEDKYRNLIDDIIRINFLEKTFDSGAKCIYTTKTDEEIEKTFDEIDLKTPEGFYLGDLKESDLDVVDRAWPQQFPESKEYLRTCIKYNPSSGLYRLNDNKLIAWSITLETGAGGHLFIDEQYRRQNFGTFMLIAHNKRMVEKGDRVKCGFILHYNDASFKMSSTVPGFLWVNNVSSIGVKKKSFDGKAPLWGHL